MTFDLWLAYVGAMLLISLSPGSGCMNTLSTALAVGFRGAWPAIAGLQVGLMIQLVVVGIGLSAVLATTPWAFAILQWAGVLYLAWIGIEKIRDARAPPVVNADDGSRGRFVRAILINSTNPKSFVFLGAFFPRFVVLDDPLLPQYGVLAITSLSIDTAVMLGYAAMAARIRIFLQSPLHMRRTQQLFGLLFLAAATGLAVSH